MQAVRILNIEKHFDRRKKRFTSLAFKTTGQTAPGISIIDRECIRQMDHSICEHIRIYYQQIASQPPAFWVFDTSLITEGHTIEPGVSSTGDKCHCDIRGLSKRQAKNFFKAFSGDLKNFQVCDDDFSSRTLSRTDLEI